MSDEYGYTKDDAAGGGGGNTPKARGTYTGTISRPEVKKDKNGKLYLGFGIKHEFGKYKNGLSFENYLPLSREVNAYQLARRNSFFKAIGLQEGSTPPGAPGGPDVKTLEGTYIDFTVEHEYENVPGEQYSLTTSKSAKSAWGKGDWESKLSGINLVVGGETIKPNEREVVTFYNISDEFTGVGGDSSDEDGSWG